MEADLLARCKQHKQKVIDRYGWNHDCLPQSFATEVAKLLEREIDTDISMIPDTAIERRSTYQYCQYLYHASKGTQEPCQHKALVAIHKFVYEIILNVSHHNQWLAEDVAQNTILTTYQKLDSVKNPGLFLAWIKQIGVREFYKALRDEKRQLGISPFGILTYLDEIENPGTVTTEPFEESEEENGDGEDNDSTETRNSRLQDILKRCLRSKKQQKAIVLLFIEEMGMKQAAKTLGITPSYLRGLKHRAIKKLRTCQELYWCASRSNIFKGLKLEGQK